MPLYEWRRRHPEFSDSLDAGKIEADAEVAESLYHRARGAKVPAVKIFMPAGVDAPVYAPYVEHHPPDVGAAKVWLYKRQPERWSDKREVNHTCTLEHRIAQMTPDERARDALELAERVRRRLAEYRMTIEHEPKE